MLQQVSLHITNDEQYRRLGVTLKVPSYKLQSIYTDYERHITDAGYWMLRHWQSMPQQCQDDEETLINKLKQALIDANMGQIVQQLEV